MGQGLAQSHDAIELLAMGDQLNHAGYYDSAAMILRKGKDMVKEEDTGTFIEICYSLGVSYLNNGKCDSALYFVNLGLDLGKKTNDKVAAGYSTLARAQGGCSGEWAQGIVTLKTALGMLERSENRDRTLLIASYNLMGYLYLYHGKYDSSQFFLEKSLSAQSQLENDNIDSVELSTTYYYLSKVHERKVNLKKSLEYGHQALAIRKDQLRPYHPSISNTTNDIGNIYKRLGNYDRALDYFLKGLEIRKQTLGEDHVNVGASYYSIGTLYGNAFNYNKAIHFIEQGNLIVEKRFGSKLPVLFTYYAFLGKLYHKIGEADKAEYMYDRSRELAEEHLDDNHTYRAFIYNSLGQYYADLGLFDQQKRYHQKALDIYMSKGSSSVAQADILMRLGSVESRLNNFSQAEKHLEKSLAIYLDRVGLKNPKVATIYRLMGELRQRQGQYLQALDFSWKSLNAVSFDQIEQDASFSLHSFTHKQMAMKSLHQIANIYRSVYDDTDDLNQLKEAYKYYELTHNLIDLIGSEYQLENSRVQLAEDTRKAFDDAMEVAYMLYELSNDDDYKEALFTIIERSKSPVLLARIQEKEARKYGNVPDSLMAMEQDLRVELTYYKEGLRNSKASGDTIKIDFYQKEVFRTRNAYNDFKTYLQDNFPTYYSYWYSNELIKLSDVQNELPERVQLMEYYEGDDDFYLVSIRRDEFEVHRIQKEDDFDTSLENYLMSLTNNVFIVDNSRKADSLYVESAAYLNDQLIEPFLDGRKGIDQLIIVPDGRLNTINFGTFLTQPISIQSLDHVNYKDLMYLLSKYAISYAYSSTLNFRAKSDYGSLQFAGFAPSYEAAAYSSVDSSSHPMAYELVRNGRLSLPGAIDEIKQINQLLKGDIWVNEDASESNFKVHAGKYGILHLAMHSLINTDEPEYSELLFNNALDSLNDGYLTIDEIYNLDIRAEMVVLSACSSGEGTLLAGEGPISFTRAFSYAGCPSVIMSMWKLPDAATSKIMVDFYENIRVGDAKNLALQKAQLAYLKNTDDPLYQHPFFWGSFVTMGSTRPIVEPNKNLLLYVILSIAGLVFVFVVSRTTINRRGN